uniref:Helitron helicase-like domain-containing protein n=1 Tax=Brassica oleracea TaxID=3712 RepID=A0A3P6F1P9_BRAOL|nr:unnamed protein product [Brassica oleracea]
MDINVTATVTKQKNKQTPNITKDALFSAIGLTDTGYFDDGDPSYVCGYCQAYMWFGERISKRLVSVKPIFTMCCHKGKVNLPILKAPPKTLLSLLYNKNETRSHFRELIRAYNMMFSFTSLGGQVNHAINNGSGPYVFQLCGENYHLIGGILPAPDKNPAFLQLYIHDPVNEIANRVAAYGKTGPTSQIRLDIHETDFPTAAIIIIYGCMTFEKRDIVIESTTGKLQRISELHPAYLPLQYPLLFPYGEDGFRLGIDIGFVDTSGRKRKTVTMREFFAFRIQERYGESPIILMSGRLFQQFLVDAYTMIESNRLRYIFLNQKNLRAEYYDKIAASADRGEDNLSEQGKRIFIPSSFTGGKRYMMQHYLDAMATCKYYGYPDFFITITCNPKWPEITRYLQKHDLKTEDRPDICCRVFKMKLDNLVEYLTKDKVLGRVNSAMYTIEFQKRGLPHAHMIMLELRSKGMIQMILSTMRYRSSLVAGMC